MLITVATTVIHRRHAATFRHPIQSYPALNLAALHHIVHWVHHGETKLDNLVMLCWTHHRMVHQSDWEVRMHVGLPEFIPPKWIDYSQKPRRKPLLTLATAGSGHS